MNETKHLEMLRIAGRDLARLGKLPEIIQELSDVADVCLEAVWQICHRQLAGRHGHPWHQDAAGVGSRRQAAFWAWASLAGRS